MSFLMNLRDFGSADVGFLALPETPPKAGVLVLPDGFGVNKLLKERCKIMAKAGYVVLAIDLWQGKFTDKLELAKEREKDQLFKVGMESAQTAMRFFKESPRFKCDHVYIVSMGPNSDIALSTATSNQSVRGVTLIEPARAFDQKVLGKVNFPVQVIFREGQTGKGLQLDILQKAKRQNQFPLDVKVEVASERMLLGTTPQEMKFSSTWFAMKSFWQTSHSRKKESISESFGF